MIPVFIQIYVIHILPDTKGFFFINILIADVGFLKEAQTYYLSTVEGNQPRVRPFGTAHIFEGKLYIQTGKAKDVSKQIHANPKVEICAFKKGEWLRVAGELVEDDRREARQSMRDFDYHKLAENVG